MTHAQYAAMIQAQVDYDNLVTPSRAIMRTVHAPYPSELRAHVASMACESRDMARHFNAHRASVTRDKARSRDDARDMREARRA